MADDDALAPQHPRLTELLALDRDARVALAAGISAKGFEPGCWVRVEDRDIVNSSDAREFVVGALRGMERLPPGALLGLEEFEGEHEWDPPADGELAWVIISQSCDLVRDVRDEPLVQLALLREAAADDDLASWSRNSARWIPLDPKGRRSRYYVDLRVQAFAAKQVLLDQDVRHAVPSDDETGKQRARRRFARRVGQRHSRAGIPTRIVERVVDPLVRFIDGEKAMRQRLDEAFSEWLLEIAEPPALAVIAPTDPFSEEYRAAEDLFEEFLRSLPEGLAAAIDQERSQVVALGDLLFTTWASCWNLDLDFLTYGARGPKDSPEPPA
jgi:hypothetical protein